MGAKVRKTPEGKAVYEGHRRPMARRFSVYHGKRVH